MHTCMHCKLCAGFKCHCSLLPFASPSHQLKAGELAELKEKHAEVLRQLTASKARNQTLSSQLKAAVKNQPSSSSSSTPLHQSSGGLSGRLVSASSERSEPKGCPRCAQTKAVYERELARKEKTAEDLKQQLRSWHHIAQVLSVCVLCVGVHSRSHNTVTAASLPLICVCHVLSVYENRQATHPLNYLFVPFSSPYFSLPFLQSPLHLPFSLPSIPLPSLPLPSPLLASLPCV